MQNVINNLKENNLKRLAEIVVKYQKFKTFRIYKEVLKIESLELGKSTLNNYINYGISYLKYGKKTHCVSQNLYEYIDDCVERCVQPLTPSASEARRVLERKYTGKEVTHPIEKVPVIKLPLTSKFIYGIRTDNRIITFDKESEMQEFMQNLSYIVPNVKLQPVTVEVEDYE